MTRPVIVRALALASALALPAFGQAPDDFAAQSREFEQRIAMFAAVDPLQPATLAERIGFAAFLVTNAGGDCLPRLAAAEQQIAPVLSAGPGTLVAQPDALPDATSILQGIQHKRGLCTEDAQAARASLEASVATGLRAIELHRENWNFEQMAIALFNVGSARRDLGDLAGALQALEQVLAWDAEFGLLDEQASDHEVLLRWRGDGAEPDPRALEAYEAGLAQRKAQLRFAWQPYEAQWSSESERATAAGDRVVATRTRVRGVTAARREGEDWVLQARVTAPAEVSGDAPGDTDAARLQRLVAGSLASGMPDVVVGADGAFRELRNLGEFRASMIAAVEKAVLEARPGADAEKRLPELRRVLDVALSAELLTSNAAQEWTMSVATWIGADLDHGDWYELTFEEPIPGLSERPVKRTMRFKLSRWVPCAADGPPRCVEILAAVVPDRDSTRLAVNDFVRRILPAGASRAEAEATLASVSYEVDARYRLVTEPETLRPWSMETRKFIYIATVDGGKRSVQARRERQLSGSTY